MLDSIFITNTLKSILDQFIIVISLFTEWTKEKKKDLPHLSGILAFMHIHIALHKYFNRGQEDTNCNHHDLSSIYVTSKFVARPV